MMKKIALGVLSLMVLAVGFAACSAGGGGSLSEKEFTIRIEGAEGAKFSGSYAVVQSDGQNSTKSVDGTVPAEYTATGSLVSTSFQKQGEDGMLVVKIYEGDELVAEQNTEAAFGVVAVTSQT